MAVSVNAEKRVSLPPKFHIIMKLKKEISNIVLIFSIIFSGCTARHTATTQGAQQDTIIENKTVEKLPYEPQIWIDNFLSVEHKDTLQVKLWSEVSHQFINEIPNDTTMDWWCWYQEQGINAVLLLNDIEPLYLQNAYALAQCYPITEGKKRAIVIVPYIAQPSYWVQCCIYTIKDNKWAEQKSFGVALWDDCGKESLQKCLVKKDGRWMYADQFDIDINPKENPYHYLFD